MNYEKYCRQSSIIGKETWHQRFLYIIGVSQNEDYLEALEYIIRYLRDEDYNLQIAAIQGIEMIVSRYYDIDEKRVFPLLFENLVSNNKRIRQETMDTLEKISHLVIRLRKAIYLEFFKRGIDYSTNKKLKIYTDKDELNLLKATKEKVEFILSYCQNTNKRKAAKNIDLPP